MTKTKRIISLIAAMANDRVIGKDNKMPWHLPADLAHFKKITLGKPIIMGRNTFESIGRALPGRKNIVVSRNQNFNDEGVFCVSSLTKAIEIAGNVEEIIIMGGGNIYQQMLPLADRLYLTLIDLQIAGDTNFPDYNQQEWQQISKTFRKSDEKNKHDLNFVTLERKRLN